MTQTISEEDANKNGKFLDGFILQLNIFFYFCNHAENFHFSFFSVLPIF